MSTTQLDTTTATQESGVTSASSTVQAINEDTARISSSATENLTQEARGIRTRLFLTRGVVAIAWAAAFAAVSDSLTTGVTVGAAVLLVLYPLIDAVASLIDARSQHGSARKILLAGTASSAVAAVALGVAATGTVGDALAVFGAWAAISGAAQLVVALRRRAVLGNQWPLLLAGGASVIAGVAFFLMGAAGDDPQLDMLAIYAATGGVEFVIQAWLLARRRRLATLPA